MTIKLSSKLEREIEAIQRKNPTTNVLNEDEIDVIRKYYPTTTIYGIIEIMGAIFGKKYTVGSVKHHIAKYGLRKT